MSLIISKNLTFSYDGKIVVNDINFSINQGDYVCIVGENGAGKSTLLKGLLRLKTPTKGEIIYNKNLHSNDIGYLPQQTNNLKDFPASVQEVVFSGYLNKLNFKPFFTKKDKNIIYENMRKMGIIHLKKKCYNELSGGQQQKVLLARALCSSEKLILLDEPIIGLDPISTNEFYSLVSEINKNLGITIIMVSHDIHSAIKYSSHILHINCNQLFFGKTTDYLNSFVGKKFVGGSNI